MKRSPNSVTPKKAVTSHFVVLSHRHLSLLQDRLLMHAMKSNMLRASISGVHSVKSFVRRQSQTRNQRFALARKVFLLSVCGSRTKVEGKPSLKLESQPVTSPPSLHVQTTIRDNHLHFYRTKLTAPTYKLVTSLLSFSSMVTFFRE